MFLRCFLCLSLVNLPLLASLEERSTCGVLDCFLEAENGDDLEKEFLVDKATRNGFALFWRVMIVPEVRLKGLFLHLSCMVVFTVLFSVAVIDGHC